MPRPTKIPPRSRGARAAPIDDAAVPPAQDSTTVRHTVKGGAHPCDEREQQRSEEDERPQPQPRKLPRPGVKELTMGYRHRSLPATTDGSSAGGFGLEAASGFHLGSNSKAEFHPLAALWPLQLLV